MEKQQTPWEKLANAPEPRLYATFREKFPDAILLCEDQELKAYIARGADALPCATHLKKSLRYGYCTEKAQTQSFIDIPKEKLLENLNKLRRHTTRLIVVIHAQEERETEIELKDCIEVWDLRPEKK